MASPWRRGVATLVGLWFTASVSGVALQLCVQPGTAHAMTGMHHMQTDGDQPDGAGALPGDHGHHHPGSQHPGSHDDCTCTGMCCVTAAVSLTATRLVAIPVVVAETPILAPPRTEALAPRAAPDVTLPPPLGPPTLRA